MKLEKVRRILSAMDKIMKRGEQFSWSGLTHISQEAGLTRQTTYRYLEKMVESDKVFKVERTWRGEPCFRYYMTQDGRDLLNSFKELL